MWILLIVVILILWYFGYLTRDTPAAAAEFFRSCRDCDTRLPPNMPAELNPFVWPYSGTQCLDSLYSFEKQSVNAKPMTVPMTHLNTPDHVEMTN